MYLVFVLFVIIIFVQYAAEVLKQIYEEEWCFYSLAADNPHYLTALEQVLAKMKKVHKEPQVMASFLPKKLLLQAQGGVVD